MLPVRFISIFLIIVSVVFFFLISTIRGSFALLDEQSAQLSRELTVLKTQYHEIKSYSSVKKTYKDMQSLVFDLVTFSSGFDAEVTIMEELQQKTKVAPKTISHKGIELKKFLITLRHKNSSQIEDIVHIKNILSRYPVVIDGVKISNNAVSVTVLFPSDLI